MIVSSGARLPAKPDAMRRDVADVLRRRAEQPAPPATLIIRDSSALTIACFFISASRHGRVFEQLARTGSVDADALVAAAEFERSFAPLSDYGMLRCLITWAQGKSAQQRDRTAPVHT